MALIPREYCVQGITRFIEDGFKLEATTDWFLEEFGDAPAIKSSGNPRKLIQNVLTIGGSGWNAERNLINFTEAFHAVAKEKAAEAQLKAEAEARAATGRLTEMVEERKETLQRMYDLEAELRHVTERAHSAERTLALTGTGGDNGADSDSEAG